MPPESHDRAEVSSPITLPLHLIHSNLNQPRINFDEGPIQELAQSIRVNGIIQPITVCKTDEGGYMIVAGERRWRAAALAGLKEIPVHVREVKSDQVLELALIENIQREDLNPMETAMAFDQLAAQHQLTHEQIAERTGKERATITNFLRLLRLTPEVREHVAARRISMGHARALVALENSSTQIGACKQIIDRDLSVRATEQLVKQMAKEQPQRSAEKPKEPTVDPNTRAAVEEMSMALGTKVKIVPKTAKSGRLEVEYYSTEDLQRIYEAIVPEK
jgi:ParB family chromosome partitioning protein